MFRYNLPERRKAVRVRLDIPAACEITSPADRSTKNKTAFIRNISTDGVYIESDELLPLGTEIKLSFQLPKGQAPISSTIKVIRVEELGDSKFGLGATFVILAERDKLAVSQMVQSEDIHSLLKLAIDSNASDLHLIVDSSPVMRVHGELQLSSLAKLSSDDIQEMIYSIMTKEQISRYEDTRELDFAIQYDSTNRFRINLHQQRGYMEATMRLISTRLLSMENLNIPDVVKDLSKLKEGLILVTGPTGAGKTTTMAVMVELINRDRKGVIVTLERPIEYVHPNIKCIVKQREIGIDTDSFSVALKSSLRQDPNVIVVGELDDIETIRTAIIAAEAGYLVIASFHAPNSVQALDRLAAMFPIDNRRQIMFQLANCLKGVIAQVLIPRKDRSGRVLATELVIVNDAVRRVLRDDDLVQLPTIIQTGSAHKMQSMVVAIKKYFEDGLIDSDAANFYSEEFTRYGR